MDNPGAIQDPKSFLSAFKKLDKSILSYVRSFNAQFLIDGFETPVVYFLFKDDKLVYIGQTKQVLKRLHEHRKSKNFDRFSFVVCKTIEDAYTIEQELIEYVKPKLNIRKGKTYENVANEMGVSTDYVLRTYKK